MFVGLPDDVALSRGIAGVVGIVQYEVHVSTVPNGGFIGIEFSDLKSISSFRVHWSGEGHADGE